MTKKVVSIDLSKFKMKWLLYFVLFFSIFYRFFCDYLGVLSACRYIIDFCLIIMLAISFTKTIWLSIVQQKILFYIAVYVLFSVITYIANFQSILYFIYGFIFRFRYYLFFVLCMLYFNKSDIEKCLHYLNVIFYINALFAFVQYFGFRLYGDHLGGIFGFSKGCNGYLNIFLVVIISISCLRYMNKEESITNFVIKVLLSLTIASFAELKIFFVEFIVLLFCSVLFLKFSWKKLLVLAVSGIGLIIGYFIFSKIYSYADDFLKLETWIKLSLSGGYAAGYAGSNEINRLTFVEFHNNKFLTSTLSQTIGLGLGNCSYSNISLFNTPFYEKYSNTKYEWFTSSYTYLEQGWTGLCFFSGFFILIFFLAFKAQRDKNMNISYCYFSEIISVLFFIILIYNNSLTMESGFLFYFVSVLPFINEKNSTKQSPLTYAYHGVKQNE